MIPQRIKYELSLKGITQQHIADLAGVTRQAVHLCIHGKGVSRPVMRLIAESIGRAPAEVFPAVFSKKAA